MGLCTAPALLTAPALHPLRTPVTAGIVHLVMEVCNGPTLQRVLDKRGALSEPETRSIMRQLVEAVVHLHARRLKSSLPSSLAGWPWLALGRSSSHRLAPALRMRRSCHCRLPA